MLSLSQCRVSLESIFVSDITTADVFIPGGRDRSSSFQFPREVQTREDWNRWFDFWHSFTTTGDKSRSPLATGSIPHIASGNDFTEKTPMTYYRSRARKCSITRRLLFSASLLQTIPTTCHMRNHSLKQWTMSYLFRSPVFLCNGLPNHPSDQLL
jgi:hypothetical protein